MELTGAQWKRLQQALLSAFSYELLRDMIRSELNRKSDDFTHGAPRERVSQILIEAEREGWTHELILGAIRTNPSNPQLKAFVQEYLSSIQRQVPGPQLEKIVVNTTDFQETVIWRDRLEEIERRVCRVEISGKAEGTGFLVAADLLLTNHHVVEQVIEGKVSPASVALRFDYKRLSDGTELQGKVYGLAQDWLLASSPHSPMDRLYPKPREATTQELDYALLRVAGRPGEEALPGQKPRAWIALPAEPYAFTPGSPILIVQHPLGDPLKLAIATEGVLEVNTSQTRVAYRTNTERGSSGSPCFNQDWRLVALHHSGDPRVVAHYNEGIPISTLRTHLPPSVLKQLGGT